MTEIVRATGLGRESLDKALSPDGNRELATALKVMRSLGFKLHVAAKWARPESEFRLATVLELTLLECARITQF